MNDEVTVTVCPDGPLLVRGPWTFRSVTGETVAPTREVTALCRCGRSRLKPLCDGSHKASRFSDDASTEALTQLLGTGPVSAHAQQGDEGPPSSRWMSGRADGVLAGRPPTEENGSARAAASGGQAGLHLGDTGPVELLGASTRVES